MQSTTTNDQLLKVMLDRLERSDLAEQWNRPHPGTPTRHAVMDDFLPEELACHIGEAFPKDGSHFNQRQSFRERKRTSVRFDELPPILKQVTFTIQSPEFVTAIGERIGLPKLIGDPSLYAGGLSMMQRGDFLNPHIDNSHEASKSRYRRVNLLYYVTPGWQDEFGGNLELWDKNVSRPVTLASLFNRLVIMETNRHSWHSVSPVVVEGMRCCVSNYFFSAESPEARDYYHVTSFTGRPGQVARRAFGAVDNAARNFARQALGLRRASDKGYRPEQ